MLKTILRKYKQNIQLRSELVDFYFFSSASRGERATAPLWLRVREIVYRFSTGYLMEKNKCVGTTRSTQQLLKGVQKLFEQIYFLSINKGRKAIEIKLLAFLSAVLKKSHISCLRLFIEEQVLPFDTFPCFSVIFSHKATLLVVHELQQLMSTNQKLKGFIFSGIAH